MPAFPTESDLFPSGDLQPATAKTKFLQWFQATTGLLGTSGTAADARTALGAVGKTGDETIAGIKTLSSSPLVPTVSAGDTSTKAANMAALAASFVQGTAQATTSGTSKDFTGIPSWVKRITVSLNGVSTAGSSIPMIQIGDSGGIETSGYVGSVSNIAGAVGTSNHSAGFEIAQGWSSSAILHGQIVLTQVSANTWSMSYTGSFSHVATSIVASGSKTLSATLDRVRLTTVAGTDAFDAGSINIMYE